MDIVATLSQNKLFQSLDLQSRLALSAQCEILQIAGGDSLFAQGTPGDALYIVASGRLTAFLRQPDGNLRVLGEIGQGETVGEMGLLVGEPRSASVQAIRDSVLIKINKINFEQVLQQHPESLLKISQLIVQRLRANLQTRRTRASVSSAKTICVCSASPDLDLAALTEQFAQNLAGYDKVQILNSTSVDSALGEGRAQTGTHSDWYDILSTYLTRQEQEYRYVIYQADNTASAWTECCLRQADRIVIFVKAGETPPTAEYAAKSPITALLLRYLNFNIPTPTPTRRPMQISRAQCALVMVHGSHLSSQSHTRAWCEYLHADQHYHWRKKNTADLARWTRLLTGRATNLVLGGGGARGFAHIGVLRALEERNMTVDAIGGASMGSFIAALYAMGNTPTQLKNAVRDMFVKHNYLNDYTFPNVSFIKAQKFRQQLRRIFGNQQIEDLAMPFFAVTSNITTGQAQAQMQGAIEAWVGASMSIPGVAPPVVWQGELHVDGGVLNNLPVDVMHAQGRGMIIASDVTQFEDLRVDWHSQHREPLQLTRSLAGEKTPNLFRILLRSATLSTEAEQREVAQYADIYLSAPLRKVGLFDWAHLEDVIQIGYENACAKLDQYLSADFCRL